MDPGSNEQFLSRQYGDSVAAEGGVPIILPLLGTPEDLKSLLGKLNGIPRRAIPAMLYRSAYFGCSSHNAIEGKCI